MIKDRVFVNECGVGFDTIALEYALTSKRVMRGVAAYLYGVLRAIMDNRPVTIDITREDGSIESRTLTVFAVANGGWIGGGMPIAPNANTRDGLFDIVMVPAMKRLQLLDALRKLMRGDVMEIPGAETFRCREIAISGKELSINVDGEIVHQDFARFKIVPKSLRIRA
ncbi:hypothetical protein AGMMS49992_23150 [Clostridia bacterium]|nr:hypothetical protein AGMMS49992_23150 [Clostridia bacterium]